MRQSAALALIIGCLSASLAVAQDRPASPPRPPAETPEVVPDDARPPERPAEPEEKAPDEATDATGAEDVAEPTGDKVESAEDDSADNDTAEMFGPPPPPQWYLLRESDQDYAACKLALSMLGTAYTEEPVMTGEDNPECGIARPIRVEKIIPDLALEGGAVMRCDTARALGLWSQEFLRPASAMLPGAPRVTSLQLGTTYDCRGRVGTGEAEPKLSEHAYGNAIDIAAFVFDNGETMPVEPRFETGEIAEGFQMAVQKAGCLFFTTVLGPGSNAAHDDHLHFDVAVRNGGWRLCE
ncbi:extensin family protein [Paracoccus caeni]|uniref:Extensin family protein n=1 Tax=Paracoccus caeni TaxID=657651 RepID=A0A934W0J2_9RHOB|nr:extensin family protein [Paracoccus caeni]MBK4216393.1 extensin family protein [Paracoccus caeni]